jgi:signal transduction histidine kinase
VDVLEVIEREATQTLAEMRAMVRMLRSQEPAEFAPQAGVADLARLASSSPGAPQVEVTTYGDLSGLPAAVDAAAFRIAQEAVTNALRHARNASRVQVQVVGNRAALHLRVRDDGDPAVGGSAPVAGYGLTGMAERAAMLGGTCVAGPCPDRGWAVEATLPRDAP